MTTTRKLRVVPLSLTPSCVTRKKTPRKLPARTPGGEKHGSRPQDFTRPLFPRGSSTVSLDGLSERRTTCIYCVVFNPIIPRVFIPYVISLKSFPISWTRTWIHAMTSIHTRAEGFSNLISSTRTRVALVASLSWTTTTWRSYAKLWRLLL